MPNILAVYGTTYGQTEKIVRRLAAGLTGKGLQVTVLKGEDFPASARLDEYDGFIVAASVLAGRHQGYVETFVRDRRSSLESAPSAFISVSGAAGSTTPENQAEARGYVEEFFKRTGWRPPVSVTFGGALAYTKYGFFLRWMTMLVTKRRGGPTDMTQDHESTDWESVDRFAERLAGMFRPVSTPAWRSGLRGPLAAEIGRPQVCP